MWPWITTFPPQWRLKVTVTTKVSTMMSECYVRPTCLYAAIMFYWGVPRSAVTLRHLSLSLDLWMPVFREGFVCAWMCDTCEEGTIQTSSHSVRFEILELTQMKQICTLNECYDHSYYISYIPATFRWSGRETRGILHGYSILMNMCIWELFAIIAHIFDMDQILGIQ